MKKVLVLPGSFGAFSDEPMDILKRANLDITKYSKPGMTEDEVVALVPGYHAIIAGLEPMTARVMDAAGDTLKIIARYGVGLDNIDQEAAKERGIVVMNTPGANADAVADYTFGLMLALARSISAADRNLKKGQWSRYTGYPVYGATLGIIGLGAIGKCVARRARGFGMKIMAYDIYWDEKFAEEYGVQRASLDEIYEQADFISLHAGLTPETYNMISTEQFKKMKKTAFIINCARGGLVDEAALYEAVVNGEIAGAGLDAFSEEPMLESPLFTLDNVVVAPHVAGSSIDAINNMGTMSAQKCVDVLETI